MNKNKISFAVIIPAYENNKYLFQTLYSIYQQKYKPNEVIIVDTSKKKINRLIVKDFNQNHNTKFQYTYYKNTKTEGRARNLASKKIKSNFIAFLDDDDYWHYNYLKSIRDILHSKKAKYDVIFTQLNFINLKNKIIKKHTIPKKINIYDLYLYNPGTLTSNMVVKRSTFFKLGMFDENYGWNDKEYLIKIINNNFQYFINKKFLVFRRVHPSQRSSNYFAHFKENLMFFLKYSKNLPIHLKIIFIKKIIFIFIKSIIYRQKNTSIDY